MNGKNKCEILKTIRRKIASENGIPYVTKECENKGDCSGTCPKCDKELITLENEINARAAAGKRVIVAALCAGMAFGTVACASTSSGQETDAHAGRTESTSSGDEITLTGDVIEAGSEGETNTSSDDGFTLMGDVAEQDISR